MNCRSFRKYVGALADGELDTDQNPEALEHLDVCESCAATVANIRKMKTALARVFREEHVAAGLADRVRARLPEAADPPRAAPIKLHRWVVPLGVAAAVLFVWLVPMLVNQSEGHIGGPRNEVEAHFIKAARSQHKSCVRMGPAHGGDALPQDREELRRTLEARIDLPVLGPDLSDYGYRFHSADLCRLGGSGVAHFLYQRVSDGRFCSIFTMAKSDSIQPTDGYQVGDRACFVCNYPGPTLIIWSENRATYVVCAKGSVKELRRMAKSIR